MQRGWLSLTALLFLHFSLSTCARPATQLLVVVDSNFPVPSRLARLRVSVLSADGSRELDPPRSIELLERNRPNEATRFALPLSFGVAARGSDRNGLVRFRVEGFSASDHLLVRREIRTSFRDGKVLRVPVFLALICEGVACEERDAACKPPNGRCESIDEPSMSYEELSPNSPAGSEFADAQTPPSSFACINVPWNPPSELTMPALLSLDRMGGLRATIDEGPGERFALGNAGSTRVAFATNAALVDPDPQRGSLDLYQYNFLSRSLCLVSGSSSASGVDTFSASADGQRIVFTSRGSLFGSTANTLNAFYFDNTLRPLSSNGSTPFGATSAVISADGATIAIVTSAALDPMDRDSGPSVYTRPSTGSAWTFVGPRGTATPIERLTITGVADNGLVLAHTDRALVPADTNTGLDVYLLDAMNEPTLVSRDMNGIAGQGGVLNSALSSNGSIVVFSTNSVLEAGDTNNRLDAYRYERSNNRVRRISVNSDGSELPGGTREVSISADGSVVGLSIAATNSQCYVWRETGVRPVVHPMMPTTPLPACRQTSVSSDGLYVYVLTETPIVPQDTNTRTDLYRLPVP